MSELALLGWRSQEQSAELDKKMTKTRTSEPQLFPRPLVSRVAQTPDWLPEECLTDGEPDTSKMTSEMAMKFLRSMGISLPTVQKV